MNRLCFTCGTDPIQRSARMFLGPKPPVMRLDNRMAHTIGRTHDST